MVKIWPNWWRLQESTIFSSGSAENNGESLQWHERFGEFKTALDSALLTDDVKLTYMKTLVTSQAKAVNAEFAYCKTLNKNAMKTLE